MSHSNIATATAYYAAIEEKNVGSIAQLLHSDVEFIGPLEKLKGKDHVLEAVKGFSDHLNSLTIRAKFGADDRVMFTYDVDFPAPVGTVRGAVLMTFQNGLISQIELFYDSSPIGKMKDEIFTN